VDALKSHLSRFKIKGEVQQFTLIPPGAWLVKTDFPCNELKTSSLSLTVAERYNQRTAMRYYLLTSFRVDVPLPEDDLAAVAASSACTLYHYI
jgi:hypothetical protein